MLHVDGHDADDCIDANESRLHSPDNTQKNHQEVQYLKLDVPDDGTRCELWIGEGTAPLIVEQSY